MTAPASVADIIEDEWLTTAEAAVYIKRAEITIRRAAANGTLRSTSAGRGRGRRYRRSWLVEWMDQPRRARRRA